MATVVVSAPDGTQNEHEINGETSIGRAEGNDLVLTAGGVSRKHARLYEQDGAVVIEDVGSANGTFVDGEKISGPMTITPNNQLVIGDYTLKLKSGKPAALAKVRPKPVGAEPGPSTRTIARVSDAKPKPKPSAAAIEKRAPRAVTGAMKKVSKEKPPDAIEKAAPVVQSQLKGLTGPWANQVWPVTGKMVIGRVAGVELQIEDDSVSRRHAEVEKMPGGVVVRDLGSANGVLLNGEPVQGEALLHNGDILQLGMIELLYEGPEVLKAPTRRRGPAEPGEIKPPSRLRVVMLGSAVVVLMVAAVGFLMRRQQEVQRGRDVKKVDTATLLQEYLNECRSYASSDLGDPDWNKAEAACNKALDIEPINPEGQELIRRVKIEQAAFDHYSRAEKAMQRLHEEEALAEYAKIPTKSEYYLKVKPRIREAVAAVLKKSASDCREYMGEGHTSSALPRCEKYMTIACQGMTHDDLAPPPGYAIKLTEGRLRRREWRPADPMYRLFLKARMKLDPGAPPWECPRIDIIDTRKDSDNRIVNEVRKALEARFSDRLIAESLFQYWKGDDSQAVLILQKIRDNVSKSDEHPLVDELRRDVNEVFALFKAGEGALQQEDPDKALEPFKEAAEIDKKLMQDLATTHPSTVRYRMQREFAEASFKKGKFWNDRGDSLKACRVFKDGFAFDTFKSNPDLSRAMLFCTGKANELFNQAGGCADLDRVLDLAFPGDGVWEKVQAAKKQQNCPQ